MCEVLVACLSYLASLIINLDSQGNFPYLEAVVEILFLLNLTEMCKFLWALPNFFQVLLSFVLLEETKAFWAVAEHRAHWVFVFLWSFLQSHMLLVAALDLIVSQACTGCSVAPVAEVYLFQPAPKWHSEISCRKWFVHHHLMGPQPHWSPQMWQRCAQAGSLVPHLNWGRWHLLPALGDLRVFISWFWSSDLASCHLPALEPASALGWQLPKAAALLLNQDLPSSVGVSYPTSELQKSPQNCLQMTGAP